MRLDADLARAGAGIGHLDAMAVADAQAALATEYTYLPSRSQLVRRDDAPQEELVAALAAQHGALTQAYMREAGRLAKAETKLQLLTAGYEARARTLTRGLEAVSAEQANKRIEYACVVRVAHDEAEALPRRVAAAQADADAATGKERELQGRFKRLSGAIADMRSRLVAAGISPDVPAAWPPAAALVAARV